MKTMTVFLAACTVSCVVMGGGRAKEPVSPNILFIFSDDHAYNALGAYGNTEVKTPNLDKLAEAGTSFTHAYNMGAWHGAVCVASRAMLNTGRFLWHVQAVDFGNDLNKEGRVQLWPERMKELGYETYFTGKWHTMGDPRKIFDHAGTLRGGMPKDHPVGYNRPLSDGSDPWSPSDPKFGGYWKGGKHWSEVLADESEGFLEHAATNDAPFFMYLAFNAPHDPRQSPQEYVDMYPPEALGLPESFVPEYEFKDGMGCGKDLRDERTAPFPRTEHAVQVNRGEYYALITHMDEQIGRIFQALEKSGQVQNTIIIYSADHGLAIGAHGLMGKQNMFEHSMRAPLIFAGPGIKRNAKVDVPVYIQDLMPSTYEFAGAPIPEDVEFRSLLPLLNQSDVGHYEAIYGAFRREHQRMVIKDGMKLILYPMIGKKLLYDLEKDPQELNNLSKNPEHAETLKVLVAELKKQQDAVGDQLDLDKHYP